MKTALLLQSILMTQRIMLSRSVTSFQVWNNWEIAGILFPIFWTSWWSNKYKVSWEKMSFVSFLFFQTTKKEWKKNFTVIFLWVVMIFQTFDKCIHEFWHTSHKFECQDWCGSLRGKGSIRSFQECTKVW